MRERLSPAANLPCKIVVVTPTGLPVSVIDQCSLSGPELVRVMLHSQYPGPSEHTCGESAGGETCSCMIGVGVGDTGVGAAIVGVSPGTICPVLAPLCGAFALMEEAMLSGVILGVRCNTGDDGTAVGVGMLVGTGVASCGAITGC